MKSVMGPGMAPPENGANRTTKLPVTSCPLPALLRLGQTPLATGHWQLATRVNFLRRGCRIALPVLNFQHMVKKQQDPLSRREREMMNIIFAREKATAGEVMETMADPPSYSAVRAT